MDSSATQQVISMRQEWDRLSQENAFHYIASSKDDWDEEQFLQSGENDVSRLVDPFLSRMRFDPFEKSMLEVGCGVGRMTLAFAARFKTVEGVDISSEMVARARALQRKRAVFNMRLLVGSGQDLKEYQDNSFDFCFSYIVLQHIPSISIILSYIREMGRVLKEGGLLLLQLNGYYTIKFPKRYYLYWGICETERLKRFNVRSRPCLRFGKLNSWDGVPVSVAEAKGACYAAGVHQLQFTGVGTQYMWLSGRKT